MSIWKRQHSYLHHYHKMIGSLKKRLEGTYGAVYSIALKGITYFEISMYNDFIIEVLLVHYSEKPCHYCF
jgi:hypothetical protein